MPPMGWKEEQIKAAWVEQLYVCQHQGSENNRSCHSGRPRRASRAASNVPSQRTAQGLLVEPWYRVLIFPFLLPFFHLMLHLSQTVPLKMKWPALKCAPPLRSHLTPLTVILWPLQGRGCWQLKKLRSLFVREIFGAEERFRKRAALVKWKCIIWIFFFCSCCSEGGSSVCWLKLPPSVQYWLLH